MLQVRRRCFVSLEDANTPLAVGPSLNVNSMTRNLSCDFHMIRGQERKPRVSGTFLLYSLPIHIYQGGVPYSLSKVANSDQHRLPIERSFRRGDLTIVWRQRRTDQQHKAWRMPGSISLFARLCSPLANAPADPQTIEFQWLSWFPNHFLRLTSSTVLLWISIISATKTR